MTDRFIHLTDLHFWEVVVNPLRLLNKRALGSLNVALKRRKQFVMERAWTYIDYIGGLDIPNVIISGDFASTSTDYEFEQGVKFVRKLEEAGKRVTVISGNHDVYTFESVRKKSFGKYFFQWLPDEPPPCAHALSGGRPIIYTPTVCPNFISSKGNITEREIEDTVALIETALSPVIVVGHYPLLNETAAYSAGLNRRLRNAEKLRLALHESGKQIVYVCGHVHRFSDERDPKFSNIRHVTTGALFRAAPESNSDGDFSVIAVDGDAVQVTRHIHRDNAWHEEVSGYEQ